MLRLAVGLQGLPSRVCPIHAVTLKKRLIGPPTTAVVAASPPSGLDLLVPIASKDKRDRPLLQPLLP